MFFLPACRRPYRVGAIPDGCPIRGGRKFDRRFPVACPSACRVGEIRDGRDRRHPGLFGVRPARAGPHGAVPSFDVPVFGLRWPGRSSGCGSLVRTGPGKAAAGAWDCRPPSTGRSCVGASVYGSADVSSRRPVAINKVCREGRRFSLFAFRPSASPFPRTAGPRSAKSQRDEGMPTLCSSMSISSASRYLTTVTLFSAAMSVWRRTFTS